MKRTLRKHVVSTVLTPREYAELRRYVRTEDKSTSEVLRALVVPMIHARVTAQEQGRDCLAPASCVIELGLTHPPTSTGNQW